MVIRLGTGRGTFVEALLVSTGVVALAEIDWLKGRVGNMGVRIHPEWCGKGIGTAVLRMISSRFLNAGMLEFQLDVAIANVRAIRCYEKVGFVPGEKFDRDSVPFMWMNLRRA